MSVDSAVAPETRIVIVGGHGKVALIAANRLREEGFGVDALIRNPEHAGDVRTAGATPVLLDIEHASQADLERVFAGADAIVFSAGAGGGNPARTHAVDYEAAIRTMAAATQAGVRRYVMVSYVRSGTDLTELDPASSFYPYAKAKSQADAYLRKTTLAYTILGPGALTLTPATGKIRLVRGDGTDFTTGEPLADRSTSRANVAEVIVHVLTEQAGIGQTINFYDGAEPIPTALAALR